MLALPNPFYKNPEANARLFLQQLMMNDTQKFIEQSLMELFTLRSLLPQGQICYCIPVGDGLPGAFAPFPTPQFNFFMPELQQPYLPPANERDAQKAQKEQPRETAVVRETKLRLTTRNDGQKRVAMSKQDECRFREDSVELLLDLREILPAEVSVEVGERTIRVEANWSDKDGVKSRWWMYELPACILAESARCFITYDGFLYTSVPWYKMEQ